MGIEDLTRIPATETSINRLTNQVSELIMLGRPTDYGYRLEDNPSSTFSVIIDMLDDPTLIDGPIYKPDTILIRFVEELDEIKKTTFYSLWTDKKIIRKTESFEPSRISPLEEIEDHLDEIRKQVADLYQLPWDEFLNSHPEITMRMQVIRERMAQERLLGLSFVSEAEIQEVMRKLKLVDPSAQID